MNEPLAKLKVLVIAEQANPEWTSVPLVGWSHACALRKLVDAHLVTQTRNKEAIERRGWVDGIDFTSIDSEKFAAIAYRMATLLSGGENKGWTMITALSSVTYPYFEHLVWKRFKDALMAGEYDVVHRITPLSPTSQSLLAKRCASIGVPFIVGPLNGGVPWPKTFDQSRREEKEWLSYVRDFYKLLPGYNSTRNHAAAILVASQSTSSEIPDEYSDKKVYIPENGVDPNLFLKPTISKQDYQLPLRLAFIGRLVPYKGPDMLIEALSPLLQQGKVVLDVYGDGPLMPKLQEMIDTHGIRDKVKLWGFVPQEQMSKQLSQAHLFTFPSIREFGGAVVLEAMSLGIVPVVINYGGPAELATPETGYLIELSDREEIIQQFRKVVTDICADPEQLAEKSKKSIERVFELFTWDAKARQVLEVYHWVIGNRKQKPDFGQPLCSQKYQSELACSKVG